MDLGVFGKAIMAFICPGVTLGDDKDCVAGDCLPGTWGDTPVAGIDPCIVHENIDLFLTRRNLFGE